MAGSSGVGPRLGDKAYRRRQRKTLHIFDLSDSLINKHIAEDLQHNCGVRPRASWRLANELSLEQVARLYNEIVGDPQCGLHGSRVWEFEQWPRRGARPSVERLQILARIYGTVWTELVDLEDLARMPERDSAEYCKAIKGGGPEISDATKGIELRTAMARLPWDELLTTNVDEQTLAQLEQELASISHLCLSSAPMPLLERVGRLQHVLMVKLKGRQRPAQTQQLFALSARACVLCGWLLEDIGNSRAAAEKADLSWAYAEFCDDDMARQWARALQSRIAFWAGNLVDSAELAAHGRQLHAEGRTETYLTLLEARAWASAGDAHNGREALRIWAERSIGPDGESSDGLFDLRTDRQLYIAGNALLSLNEEDEALRLFDASLAAQQTVALANQFYAVEHLRHLDVFRARIRKDDLDGAVEAAEPMFALNDKHRIRMVVLSAARLGAELASGRYKDSRLALSFTDRIQHFCAAANASTAISDSREVTTSRYL